MTEMTVDYHNVEGRSQPNQNEDDGASKNQNEDDEVNETMREIDAAKCQQFESRTSLKTHQKPDRGHLYHDPHFAECQVQGAAQVQDPQVHHLDYLVLNRSA